MTIKAFLSRRKLQLTRERARTNDHDNLTLKSGNKVLCTMHISDLFIHIFPEHNPDGDVYMSLTTNRVKVGKEVVHAD